MSYQKNSTSAGSSYNQFDLSSYETVKSRKTRLRLDYPESLIYPMQVSGVQYADRFVVYLALVWKDKKTKNTTPEAIAAVTQLSQSITPDNVGVIAASIGLLLNADSTGHSLSIAGGAKADKNAWVENCEESAVGRALDNLGYHSGSCSQEEIIKVKHTEQSVQARVKLENDINALLATKAGRGEDLVALHRICMQATKQFSHLQELSIDQLEKVFSIIQSTNAPIAQTAK